jgi:hypothetical protein
MQGKKGRRTSNRLKKKLSRNDSSEKKKQRQNASEFKTNQGKGRQNWNG